MLYFFSADGEKVGDGRLCPQRDSCVVGESGGNLDRLVDVNMCRFLLHEIWLGTGTLFVVDDKSPYVSLVLSYMGCVSDDGNHPRH